MRYYAHPGRARNSRNMSSVSWCGLSTHQSMWKSWCVITCKGREEGEAPLAVVVSQEGPGGRDFVRGGLHLCSINPSTYQNSVPSVPLRWLARSSSKWILPLRRWVLVVRQIWWTGSGTVMRRGYALQWHLSWFSHEDRQRLSMKRLMSPVCYVCVKFCVCGCYHNLAGRQQGIGEKVEVEVDVPVETHSGVLRHDSQTFQSYVQSVYSSLITFTERVNYGCVLLMAACSPCPDMPLYRATATGHETW